MLSRLAPSANSLMRRSFTFMGAPINKVSDVASARSGQRRNNLYRLHQITTLPVWPTFAAFGLRGLVVDQDGLTSGLLSALNIRVLVAYHPALCQIQLVRIPGAK